MKYLILILLICCSITANAQRVLATIDSDTTFRPPANTWRLAYINNELRLVGNTGNTNALYTMAAPTALQMTVIDSTLSAYTITNDTTKYLAFQKKTGSVYIYTSSLYYYFPKFTAGATITINLPNPALTANKYLYLYFYWNKYNTINFNYPVYYTVNNVDYGLTQMTNTLQTIPTTSIKASWFVTTTGLRKFYVANSKWYIL